MCALVRQGGVSGAPARNRGWEANTSLRAVVAVAKAGRKGGEDLHVSHEWDLRCMGSSSHVLECPEGHMPSQDRKTAMWRIARATPQSGARSQASPSLGIISSVVAAASCVPLRPLRPLTAESWGDIHSRNSHPPRH